MATTSQRVVITGATGLIGRLVCAALQKRGYELVIFSRDPAQARTILPAAATYVAWSPAAEGPWAAALDGVAAVVHLAGAPISKGLLGPRWTDDYKAQIRDSRVLGTRGIVSAMAAAAHPPAVFVCASAIGYYGYRDATPLNEESPAGSDFVADVTVAWEREAARAQDSGVRTVRLRTGLFLDPDDGVLPQIITPFKLRSGGPVGSGDQYYSWIHPADHLNLLLNALSDERYNGPINATAPNPVTNREFAATLGKVLNSPSWLPVPEFSLRLTLGEMADLVVKGQRVLPARARALGYEFKYPALEPALRDLLK
ncbi:TIGR01777 family protein [Candidatus Gracilibacteria bacterium]|nr:TIGR01777 family protein [Candidatus Gracilibacteria bacterium]